MSVLIPLIGIVGEYYIGECSKCDDEAELLITEQDLICQDCGSHEPHYTD
jgi:Zn finger protein HypA/HybF involved in hydrogenase expression